MKKRYWLIRGHDGFKPTFEMKVCVDQFTEGQLRNLLKALAAKACLTETEIVGAYAKRKTTIANDLLAVQKDGPYPDFSCGTNPYFTAMIVDERGKKISKSSLNQPVLQRDDALRLTEVVS
jgi:hypothetical protein